MGGVLALCWSGCSREPAEAIEEGDGGLAADLSPGDPKPEFEFPDSARCSNESLNEFLDEFGFICERGEYDRYRLALSRQIEPVQKRNFERIWNTVEHVRVELIKRLPEMEEVPSPAYAVLLQTRLREEYVQARPERRITMVVFQERGEWVFAPPADERIGQAMRRAAPEPAGNGADSLDPARATSQPAGD